tara:strand:+ start:864 stop:1343 length:480 start_codon:yes stop_codon:yes gene_type:complete
MTPADYIAFVTRQSSHDPNDRQRAAALGLMAEAGEVAGLYERALRAGQPPVDPDALAKELGDCLFYWTLGNDPDSAERELAAVWDKTHTEATNERRILLTTAHPMRLPYLPSIELALYPIFIGATWLGLTVGEVAARNVAKLEKRNAEGSITDRSRRTP